jgi:hypothetical protein
MPDYTWNDFPACTETPIVEHDRPRERVVLLGGVRYLELPDNGWHLLFAWLAGPLHVCRRIDISGHPVTTILRDRRGTPPLKSSEPRTEEDWTTIDQMVNSYLHDAGVPPRPRGFVWYLELPPAHTPREIWNAVNLPAQHGDSVNPNQVRTAMANAAAALYSET